MRQFGYRTLTASDGLEGFQIAQVAQPNLIVSDVAMSPIDGIELCHMIRAHPLLRSTPLLLISGLPRDSKIVVEALHDCADDYLRIPCEPALLATMLVQLIERNGSKRGEFPRGIP